MRTRQAVLVEPGRFELRDAQVSPRAGELLVRVHACGLCTWEMNHWKGLLGECPQTLGHEIAGSVVELGTGVDSFEIGQPVTGLSGGLHGFADFCIMPADRCVAVSCDVPATTALGEPLKCVITTLSGAAPAAGEVGVVVGCGPMGLWCLQALADASLAALVAVDVSEAKLNLARQCGATHTVQPRDGRALQAIAGLTGERMADFVIEGTGQPGVLSQAIEYLKIGRGRLVVMSSHEEQVANFDFRPLMARGAVVHFTQPAYTGYTMLEIEHLRRAVALYNQGVFKMDRIVTHRFALEDIQRAFETLEQKPADYVKGIVVPGFVGRRRN
jgi:L-iditol 2-dehydrogenase